MCPPCTLWAVKRGASAAHLESGCDMQEVRPVGEGTHGKLHPEGRQEEPPLLRTLDGAQPSVYCDIMPMTTRQPFWASARVHVVNMSPPTLSHTRSTPCQQQQQQTPLNP